MRPRDHPRGAPGGDPGRGRAPGEEKLRQRGEPTGDGRTDEREDDLRYEREDDRVYKREDDLRYGGRDDRAYGHRDDRVHGHTDDRVYEREDDLRYGRRDDRAHEPADSRTHEPRDARTHGRRDDPTYERQDRWDLADPDVDGVRAGEVIAEGVRGAAPGEIPARLCAVAVDLLPVIGASVSLRSDGMPVQLSASGEDAAYLAEVQATLGDGPCQRALETGAPVQACDLTAGHDARRWPVFAQQATAVGVRAVYALPLGNGSVHVGTLDLYRDTPGALTARQLRVAQLVAGVMTVALMALPREEEPDVAGGEPWLSGLAAGHDEVYQAVGMIMAQLGIGADEALARLRAHAFAGGRTALDVAREVVAHRKRFDRD